MLKITPKNKTNIQNKTFDPHRLISDEGFQKNLTALLTYYHMLKKESKSLFLSYDNKAKRLVS
jgi:hypothetical protein